MRGDWSRVGDQHRGQSVILNKCREVNLLFPLIFFFFPRSRAALSRVLVCILSKSCVSLPMVICSQQGQEHTRYLPRLIYLKSSMFTFCRTPAMLKQYTAPRYVCSLKNVRFNGALCSIFFLREQGAHTTILPMNT